MLCLLHCSLPSGLPTEPCIACLMLRSYASYCSHHCLFLIASETDIPTSINWSFSPCPHPSLPESTHSHSIALQTNSMISIAIHNLLSRDLKEIRGKKTHIFRELAHTPASSMPYPLLSSLSDQPSPMLTPPSTLLYWSNPCKGRNHHN